MAWTVEQVLALAPDASAPKTARDLASATAARTSGRPEAGSSRPRLRAAEYGRLHGPALYLAI